MRKRSSLLYTAVALAAMALLPCMPVAGQKQAHPDQLYIEVSALGELDYFHEHKLGMKQAGEALGVQTDYVGPRDYDMAAMVAALEQAIARKPAGLVVVGFEPSLNPIVDKAVAAGIPVVTVDGDLPGSKRIAFVGTDEVKAGYEVGKKLAHLVGKGKVALLYKPGPPGLEERRKGFEQAIHDSPGVDLVEVGDTRGLPEVGTQVARAMLQKHPDLAGFGCVEPAGVSGAPIAVKEAGKAGRVKIVAMDRHSETLQNIHDGVIQATVARQTALMPFYAVQILYDLRNNPRGISTDNARPGISGVPKSVDVGVVIIDKDNCSNFVRSRPCRPATQPQAQE